MSIDTTAGAAILRPEEVGNLVVRPLQEQSRALLTSTVVTTSSHEYRIPVVSADPLAAFVAEGAEITAADQTLVEVNVVPSKVAGLTVITSELANDSTPAAVETVGQGLVRDIARRVDEAYFGALAAPALSGLGALAGVNAVAAGSAWTNLDPFAEAIAEAEAVGATLNAFVTSPATAQTLAKLKVDSTSNQPLLGVDATSATKRSILGVPVLVSEFVPADTVYGLDSRSIYTGLREGSTVVRDDSAYFTSDRVAIRATMRIGFGFAHPAAVQRITVSAV